jgi:hypothetical protein
MPLAPRLALHGRLALALGAIAACGRGATRADLLPASPSPTAVAPSTAADTTAATRIRWRPGYHLGHPERHPRGRGNQALTCSRRSRPGDAGARHRLAGAEVERLIARGLGAGLSGGYR